MDSPVFVPPARLAVASAALRRPDWTRSDARDPRLLWLDKNENTDPALLEAVFRAVADVDPRTIALYPDATPLYLKLAEQLNISAHCLVLAPGSDGIIGSIFRAFIDAGDGVLLPSPTYAMYEVYCAMHGAAVTRVDYEIQAGEPYLSPDAVVRAILQHRPKLVCLPNPDSPTGTVTDRGALRHIIETALAAHALVLVDEAYYPFYPDTVASWIAECPNLIVARTFSKAWGLTGLRIGLGITDPANAALMQKVRPNYEVNGMAVAVALTMISRFGMEMEASVARLNRGRDEFLVAMRELGLRTLTPHASFCHVAFDGHSVAVHAALRDVVLYRADFDVPCLRGFSRFSATTPELFQPVVDAIRGATSPRP